MFQLLEFTEVHVASVTNRAETHGEDKVPAVSLGLELTGANSLLDSIDPKIREALYTTIEGQDQLPGVEVTMPVLRCNSFDRHTLPTSYEGWTLQVDDGIDDTKPISFGGCKVDKFSFEAKQGGSVELRFRVGTSDVDADKLGKLAMHNGQSIWITLRAPEKKPDAIDGSSEAFEKDHPDAGSLFAEAHGDGSEGGADEGLADGAPWPFPKDAATETPPQSVTVERSQPGTRTARGREKTKAALAAGVQG